MGFVDWLKSWVSPKRLVRNVSGLHASATSADAAEAEEIIDAEGGPLKEHHRRRALRDRRLLPKPPSQLRSWFQSKKKVFDREEADRLFSFTFRTRNRGIRDLATDREQLHRYGLPVWESEEDLADALGVSLGTLRHYSIHRQRETSPHYVTFAVPKRSGGHRLIHAPKQRLKALQRQLNELLVGKLPQSNSAHGFRTRRSVATNARPHVGKAVVIKLDLKDCFPSIHFGRVRGLLIAYGYSYPVATALSVLMTEAERQPVEVDGRIVHVPVGPRVCVQGAPTSPGLCNAVLARLDRRIAGLARKQGYDYTRYADDLTLSGEAPEKAKFLVAIASRIIREEGFRPNRQKTRILRRSQRQAVTGVVVNQDAGLSRKHRRRLRAAIHQLAAGTKTFDKHEIRQLGGRLAYLKMLNPDQAAPLLAAFRQATNGRMD